MIYNYHLLFKFIIVGDANVGKSSMLLRFIDNKFSDNYESTLGVQFGSKLFTVGTTVVKTMIWDTAGQESFKSIIRSYYKNSILAIMVFDITEQESFDNIRRWVQEIQSNANEHTRLVLVGNKVDLNERRIVRRQIAQQYADSLKIPYFEASAKIGSGVSEIFTSSAQRLVADIQSKKLAVSSISENIGVKIGNPDLQNREKGAIQISGKIQDRKNCSC